MDEPKGRPPIADDPRFLASLNDLDAGITEPARPRAANTPTPPSIADAFDALNTELRPAAAAPQTPRRPLLELFPNDGSRPRQASVPRVSAQPPAPVPHRGAERRATPQRERPSADSAEHFYGLREKPFALSADPRFFFHSRSHDGAGQELLTAFRERQGLAVLTGESGTGKTTLCRVIVEELDRRTLLSLITEPFGSAEDLLKQILCDFGVLSREEIERGPLATRDDLSATLQSFVESLAPLDASAVLVIDAAQNLPPDVLDQVRLLCEAADTTRLLQVVLVGQPSLGRLLRRGSLRTLNQRIAVRATLQPLADDEIGPYVSHRLAAAGDDVHVQFDERALARISTLSRGVPRTINLLCDRALAHGHEAASAVITGDAVAMAAEDLDLGSSAPRWRDLGAKAGALAALALFAALGAAAAAWLFRDALARALSHWR